MSAEKRQKKRMLGRNRVAAQAEVERTLRLWPKFEQIFG
jgi:hypothetical protein